MGIRSNIYGCYYGDTFLATPKLKLGDHACLGKCYSYLTDKDPSKLKSIKWLKEKLVLEDDKDILDEYISSCYLSESDPPFQQAFTRDEMREFIKLYYEDKNNYSEFKGFYGHKDAYYLLNEYDLFVLELGGS